jgi:3-oxoacyl-[acyl-carrier-protein] synthase-1/3-oxoacyl-[acyl-carrier-protein] synthase II
MKRFSPVAISGVGCLTALGPDLAQCMEAMFRGERNCGRPTRLKNPVSLDYPVFEVSPDFFPAKDHNVASRVRSVQLALTAVEEALNDAQLSSSELQNQKVGICLGATVTGSLKDEGIPNIQLAEKPEYLTPEQRFLLTSPVLGIANQYHASGPLQTIVTACSAGSDAIGLAAQWIQSGICDLVLTGGVDELYEITYNGFVSLMNCDTRPCRPFDASRNGLNLGEGAGLLVLESEQALAKRGGRPKAFVYGYGNYSDAYHLTSPSPEGQGLRNATLEALEVSGVKPEQIGFINAHGTGTLDNDFVEASLFQEIFPHTPFLSTKGYTGHTLAAAGAVEAAFTISCLERQHLPPSGGFSTPDPELPASPISTSLRVQTDFALSQTLAFGGINSVLVLGREKEA